MRLYFETNKYPNKSGTLSLAIDTESKAYKKYWKVDGGWQNGGKII